MLSMILRMSAVSAVYIILTYVLWLYFRGKEITSARKIGLGLIYGLCAILSTHYGIDYEHMMLNIRDAAPLSAGLFFDPVSGIIAGIIGGVERFIVGEFYNVGAYTRIACSVSTLLAGIVSALLHIYIFKKKKPSAFYAFFMGAMMEAFHMYVVFITHRDDVNMAFYVVKTCAFPMIIFTGIALALTSVVLSVKAGEWKNPFRKKAMDEVAVSQKFQFWLFVVTTIILILNFTINFLIETKSAMQNARDDLDKIYESIKDTYEGVQPLHVEVEDIVFGMSEEALFEICDSDDNIISGVHKGGVLPRLDDMDEDDDGFFKATLYDTKSYCKIYEFDELKVIVYMPMKDIYSSRDARAYEIILAYIIVFTVIYILVSMLVQNIVVGNLQMVNESLNKITDGDLNEKVDVYSSYEFASLSNDINQTVSVLKNYINAAEKRVEQELFMAKSIQESSLPRNFTFPRKDFEIYATMDAAKEVGGDFYDFFFIDANKLCMVIADVSGKGIPAALFMMRSKTTIRSMAESGKQPAEIFQIANDSLCEGNDASMFVTVWIGIIDLETGHMVCSNAGHEYPVIMRAGGEYELYKQKHNVALAVCEGMKFREYEIDLNPGDRLFVYTDGVPESKNKENVQYETDRLLNILNKRKDASDKLLLPAVRRDIESFVNGADQFDDITMLGFSYKGNEQKS
ncbi:MAG: SpoIIE family protein phosphatase [Eubacterium sp.]|nr:SpoIIE family protein phosphatase [Eubacterium sp.]